jgi:hypothetical protein
MKNPITRHKNPTRIPAMAMRVMDMFDYLPLP